MWRRRSDGFTMIELIFVIIVIGILAVMAIPRMQRDLRQEAADNVLSAIRYTQHLALIDNRHSFNNPKWQRSFWRIEFVGSNSSEPTAYYVIGSDSDNNGELAKSETAIDPANGKYMHNTGGFAAAQANDESPNIFIGKKYGVTSISASGGCSNKYIGFDRLGRPYNSAFSTSSAPDYSGLITSDCNLTFTLKSAEPFSIIIKPETGYAYIDGQPDS